jgi:hypothetical protein
MSNNDDKSKELADIKANFYAIMENYPTIYANSKMTPNLPSAIDARNKTEAALTSLHNRMFMFGATLEKELDDNEEVMAQLAKRGAQLNAKIARRTSILDSKDAIISQMPSTYALVQASNANTKVVESFVNGASQLPGCNLDASGNATKANCPCVMPGSNTCNAACGAQCPATTDEISLVSEARDIEMKAYFYAISRIVYLFVGICMVSYFIFQTVGMPDSTILNDAKIKAEQITNKASNLLNIDNANPNINANQMQLR